MSHQGELKITIDECRKLLKYMSKGYKVPKIIHDTVYKIALREIEEKDKVVLIKRDPNIEGRRIQGSRIKIIEGAVMRIPPPIVGGYGADHDGDSILAQIVIYDKNNNVKRCHISTFDKLFNCEFENENIKQNGVVVKNYKILDEVYTNAIDINSGNVGKKRITNWSIHENLKMYKISRCKKLSQISDIKNLWVSNNHSLVVYDISDNTVKKLSPEDIIKDKSKYFLLKSKEKINHQTPFVNYMNLKYNNEITESEMGFLLGCWLGDGYITYNGNVEDKINAVIGFTNSVKILNSRWAKYMRKITRNTVTENEDRKSNYGNNWFKKKDGTMAALALRTKVVDTHLAAEIIKHFSKGCSNKHLPYWIANSTNNFCKGLFTGYLLTDGTFNNSGYISFTSKSENLINDFKFMLDYKFDVEGALFKETKKYLLENDGTKVECKSEDEYRDYYKLDIKVTRSNVKFFEEILELVDDMHPEKREKLKNAINAANADLNPTREKVSCVPYQIIKNMSIIDRKKLMGLTNEHTHNIKYKGYCQKNVTIPEELINNSNLPESCKQLLRLQNENLIEFIPCKFLDIEFDPDLTIGYDLTVDDYRTFITDNGIFVWDTMAVIAPLSEEAQQEIKDKMIVTTTNLTINDPNYNLSKEAVIGIFTATYLKSNTKPVYINELKQNLENEKIEKPIIININGKMIETTVGKYLFNKCLPSYVPYINTPVDSKELKSLLKKLCEKNKEDFSRSTDLLDRLGFKISTLYPLSMSLDMLTLSPELKKMKNDLGKEKDPNKQDIIFKQMREVLMKHLETAAPDIYLLAKSGAVKDIDALTRTLVAKGMTVDSKGNLLPVITTALGEGYSADEMFNVAPSARKGLVSKALNTAQGGYAYRKFIYVMGPVTANVNLADCGTTRYFRIKLTKELFSRMPGRYCVNENGAITRINEGMIGKFINVRSPIYCRSKEICRLCYGDLIYQLKSKNVGIIAAQTATSLSESVMKCSDGLIQYKNKLWALEDLWEELLKSNKTQDKNS